ncbi:hypothetical protein [Xanthomonas sacchari]|uniref:hypothetical protein n=1 Tax=Xanthomonas sacchari TaxID=56458 RepID=UPI003528F871
MIEAFGYPTSAQSGLKSLPQGIAMSPALLHVMAHPVIEPLQARLHRTTPLWERLQPRRGTPQAIRHPTEHWDGQA